MVLEEQHPGELVQIIKKQKPYLKDTSIAQYIRSIKKLNQLINGENAELENFNFIEDAKKIKEVLEQFHFTTRRNYYSAIITLLQAEDKPNKKLIREYSDIVKQANTEYEEQQEKGKVSEKQKDSLLIGKDFSKIQEFIDKVKASKDEMLYILLRIITTYHTRNEIATLKLIKLRDFKKLKDEEKQGNNYLVMGSKKILIVRYDFKTNKKYKEITIEVDDKKLAKEIRS